MNLDDISGYAEAVAWEASVRAEAFLDIPRNLLGCEVLPLTLHRMAVLTAAQSPFLCGGAPTVEAVAIFLWVVSPGFSISHPTARTVFLAGLRDSPELGDLPACVREIGAFVEEMFLDSPAGGGGKSGAPVTSSEAMYCDVFADAYGWTDAQTMNTPLPRLFQMLRRITLRDNPKAVFVNRRSDRVRGEWLRAQQPSP